MNILLINPPRSPANAIFDHAPAEAQRFVHKKLIGPPLGLLTLATAVADHDVSVLEMKGEYDLDPEAPAPAELVRRYIERTNPRVVGVTFIASEFPVGMDIFRTVKALKPDIVTVAGGLHATLCPQDFADPAVDVVCTGPAAHTFRALVQALDLNEPLEQVPGLRLRHGTGLTLTGPAPPCEPAGRDFLVPDRSHLKRWLNTYIVKRAHGPSTYVFTSLGCPYRCSFCSIWPQFQGHYHQREVESVIAELKGLDDYGVVRFADANTLVHLDFAEQLADRIIEEGIRKTFVMDIRSDTAARHPKLIEKLARAGLKVAIAGFESFRQSELERYGKSMEADLIETSIRVFHDNGIMLRGNYIVPLDYGEDDFKALADYAGAHSVAFAGYTILTPMPGTRFHEEAEADITDRDLAKYNMFNCVMKTRLDLETFYERVGALWLIREGTETI